MQTAATGWGQHQFPALCVYFQIFSAPVFPRSRCVPAVAAAHDSLPLLDSIPCYIRRPSGFSRIFLSALGWSTRQYYGQPAMMRVVTDKRSFGARLLVALIFVIPRQPLIFGMSFLVRLDLIERQDISILSRGGTSHWHDR